MAGELTCAAQDVTGRNSIRSRVTHDSGTWPGVAANYTLTLDVGPVGGPYVPADVGRVASGCPPLRTQPLSPSDSLFTVGHISNLTPGTTYEMRWRLFDDNNVQVDEIICGPATTESVPTTAVCLFVAPTQTEFSMSVSNADGGLNYNAPCNEDQFTYEWGTTPGGPYPNIVGPIGAASDGAQLVTGATPATTYYFRKRFADSAGVEYLVSPECTATTQAAAALFNAQCPTTTDIADTQTTLTGTADNVPATHTIWTGWSTTAGGPYTYSPGGVAGNNTVGQENANTFISMPAGTQIFTITEIRDAGNFIVETSAECDFTTLALPDYIDGCPTDPFFQNVTSRTEITAGVLYSDLPVPFNANQFLFEVSTVGPTGPWVIAELDGGATPNPSGPAPNAGVGNEYTVTGLIHNTQYWIQTTLLRGDGETPNETQVCGPLTTLDYPTLLCDAGAVGPTTWSGTATAGPAQNGGTPNIEQGGSRTGGADTFAVAASTTPGGPYNIPGTFTPALGLSFAGLTPETQYYYQYTATEDRESFGVYATSPECTFTTAAAPIIATMTDCTVPPLFVTPPAGNGPGVDPAPPVQITTKDVEENVLCDDNGSFIQRRTFNGQTGALETTNTFTLAGAAYVPVGTVKVCEPDEAIIPAPVTGTISRTTVTNAGSSAAGIWSATFTNVGATTVQVNGEDLLPGETVEWTGYVKGDGGEVRLPAIPYDATGGTLRIATVN